MQHIFARKGVFLININLLRGKMAEAGMSQKDLAFSIGVSQQTLSYKFKGKRQFTIGEALAICDVLNLSREQRVAIFLPQKSHLRNGQEEDVKADYREDSLYETVP